MAGISPAAILLGLLGGPQILQSLTSMYPAFQVEMAKKAFTDTPNLASPGDQLVGQARQGIIDKATFHKLMTEVGYDQSAADRMFDNARSFVSALDYITAWRRGKISESYVNDTLEKQGITPEDISVLKEVTIYYPTPQDLVRFGVRDVFTPSTVSAYGLDQDYPPDLDQAALKAGLTPEISRMYWEAHWELPSPTQVFDMLHRGLISETDVATYLKSADYMPFWRDKLTKISYDNLTRVDTRRMYEMGVLSESEVNRAYQDMGYSPENAARLTRFTVLEAHQGADSTPKASIVAAYKAGLYDRGLAEMELEKSGVDLATSNLLLDTADASLKQELIDLEADAIVDQYQRGLIDKSALQSQLTQIGVPARMLQLTVEREIAQARKRQRGASKTDLDTWWRMGVIGEVKYRIKMTALGYSTPDINLYLAEMGLDDLTGKDKKYPWAETLRHYSDGMLSESGVIGELITLGYTPEEASTIVALVPKID